MSKERKFVALLSGGLDSTVNLKLATLEGKVVLALTIDYGQKARKKETECSALICQALGVPHRVVKLPWLKAVVDSGLIRGRLPSIRGREPDRSTMERVWVPARNLLFASIGAVFAEAMSADTILFGFNKEEGEVFPDNSPQFVAQANALLRYSSLKDLALFSFTLDMTKAEIAKLGMEIGAPLELCWPCYLGGKEICRRCESCYRFFNALRSASILDIWEEKRKAINLC